MELKKLVHETRGKCWHEPKRRGYCTRCKCRSPRQPDYENDMNACMELWEEAEMDALRRTPHQHSTLHGYRAFYPYPEDHFYRGAMKAGPEASTPQLAIIHAYLASKGVTVGED